MVQSINEELRSIDTALIDEPQSPMRTYIDPVGVADLAESIRTTGLISPITVLPRGDRFEVVAGHRRLLACRLAGLGKISCVVRELSDSELVGLMGTENLERSNTDPIDEAIFCGKYVGEDESKIPELAKKLNRSVAWVRGRLDMLTYDEQLLTAIRNGQVSLGVASYLALITDERIRSMFVRDAAAHSWTTLQAEYQYNLWKCGALDQVDNPPPLPDGSPVQEQAHARAECQKCGRMAVDPNLRSVFIHVECPSDDPVAPAADSTSH
jgi:ParB/RepB/Spo0J family partition protein